MHRTGLLAQNGDGGAEANGLMSWASIEMKWGIEPDLPWMLAYVTSYSLVAQRSQRSE
jgi:hypothetical protein